MSKKLISTYVSFESLDNLKILCERLQRSRNFLIRESISDLIKKYSRKEGVLPVTA